ncbi:MAG: MarR family winged helix-turn-helix transcriptional regulator [Pseudomonadota bacterium]
MQVNRTTPGQRPLDPRLFLRDEELDRGAALIFAAERALSAAMRPAKAEAGLNDPEIEALMAIRAAPGITVSALRARLDAAQPTLARTLGMLSRKGLIERERAAADGRRRTLRLTGAGAVAGERVAAAIRDALRSAYRDAGAESVEGARLVLEALAGGPE